MESLQLLVRSVSRKLQRSLNLVVSKKPKQKKRLLLWKRSFIFIILGLILIIVGGIKYYKTRILSFTSTPPVATVEVKDTDNPTEIIIPSINIDLPVDPGIIENGVWKTSDKNATFLSSSAAPATGGNTVIYAHNKKTIFGNLPYLSIGQKITLKTKSGKMYNYIVTEKFFVKPDRIDLVSPSTTEQLTLYTCWGMFDQERAVIKAIPE